MAMTRWLRKLTFTVHITFAVGWLGAVVAYLVLAVIGWTSQDIQMVRAAYLSMEVIGWYAIVPLSLAALTTGLIQSLGTEWGLFRHYWILVKFLLTAGGTIILLIHMQTVSRVAGIVRETSFSSPDFGSMQPSLVVHAVGGLMILLTATVLSVFKPLGRTPYGRRKQQDDMRK